jgi:transcriptional regulator with XRE-family HTH domain
MLLRIRAYRIACGLSQAAFARRLGMNHYAFSYIESGRARPNDREFALFSAFFGENTNAMLEPLDDSLIRDAGARA